MGVPWACAACAARAASLRGWRGAVGWVLLLFVGGVAGPALRQMWASCGRPVCTAGVARWVECCDLRAARASISGAAGGARAAAGRLAQCPRLARRRNKHQC